MRSKKNKFGIEVSRRTFITALASLPVLSLPWNSANAETFKPFSFVFITDTHLTTGVPDEAVKLLQESQLFLQDSIKEINALNPDFVIFGGDQVETIGAKNDANWQLFIDLAQNLRAPYTFVLGEMDVSGKTPIDKMKQFGLDFKGRGITSNEPYWSTDPLANVHLIGLDTSQPNSSTGDISTKQLEWLKKDLAANKGKFTIIAAHHPLLAPPPFDGGPPLEDYVIPNGSDAREIIGGSTDVHMVLSGHLYLNKVQVERDVYHISCAGLDAYPCQYKLFKVTKDAITMESYSVQFGTLIKKGMKSLESSSYASKVNRRNPERIVQLCDGSPEDQNALLTLGATKSIKELSRKQLREDTEKRDDEIDKEAEAAKNKAKGKGKGKGKSKKDKSKEQAFPNTPEKRTTDTAPPTEEKDSKDAAESSDKNEPAADAVPMTEKK